ncbi:MAG: thioredoxin domain-containing protein [Deltaproteobacteria bacterium]|nr:thioredoxin domain-containing protein [Deltaproteobacteria bacterium]
MKRFIPVFFPILILVSVGCEKMQNTTGPSENTAAPSTPPPAPPAPEATTPAESAPSGALAMLNGEAITDAEVSERMKNQLRKVESQIYDIKKEGLDLIIEEKLVSMEAKKKGMSADELIKAEVERKVEEPTEAEISAFYSMFKKRFKDAPLDKVRNKLVDQIKSTKRQTAYNEFVESLSKNAKLEVLMERPRAEVSVDDDPSKGDAKAPVTLVEFSDFQCPFCKRARETVSKVLETYGNKVHYVFRDYPLSFHKQAKKAAEAAECAGDQKKYWEYNAILWEKQGQQEIDKLKGYAKELGLNEKKFAECLDSDKYAEEVDKDLNDGIAAGVSGTPAYFVNGMLISGAQPFERFKELIDEELERLGKK